VNGITIAPRPVLGEPIPQGCLYLLVWIPSSHGVQSSACADVNIWSRNEKERPCWRDGRGIREVREKMGEKIGKCRDSDGITDNMEYNRVDIRYGS
jgi:hypothetical protein